MREREREIAQRQNSIPNRAVPNGTDTNSFRHVYFAAVWLTQTHTRDKHTESDRTRGREIKRFNQNAEEKMKNVYSLEFVLCDKETQLHSKKSVPNEKLVSKRRAKQSAERDRERVSTRKKLCLAF